MRPAIRGIALALSIVFCVIAGWTEAVPAHAGPAFSCIPKPVPTPECVFRIDTRSPLGEGGAGGVFDSGFSVPGAGTNENLLDHVFGRSAAGKGRPGGIRNTTNLVSTSEDSEFAAGWIRATTNPRFATDGGWVYSITPTEHFVSMNASLKAAAGSADRQLAASAKEALSAFGYQREWSALGGIPREQIVSARKLGPDGEWVGEPISNPRYAPAASHPSVDPYPIRRVSEACVSGRAIGSTCRLTIPASESELSELHRANLPKDLDPGELDFTFRASTLEGVEGRLLAPLPQTRALLDEIVPGGGSGTVNDLSTKLRAALSGDLSVLDAVSAHAPTVSRALSGVGKTVSRASELLPYAALAATGYVLSDDIRSGNWVDAGFDGVALALIAVGEAQPELLVFTEPALLMDLALQWVVDEFRASNAPAPTMEPWQRDQALRDLAVWNTLPSTLAALRLQHTEEQLVASTYQTMRERVLPALQARLASDLQTLDAMRASAQLATQRAAVESAGGVESGVESAHRVAGGTVFEAIRAERDAALKAIDRVFESQKEARRAAYADALGAQVQAVADRVGREWSTGSAAYETIRTEFDREIATPAIDAAEARMREYSLYQTPPIAYPTTDALTPFRTELKELRFASYEAEYARLFPRPLQVPLPYDAAEYRRLLDGTERAETIALSHAWGRSVPGGVTGEITIRDATASVTGQSMVITAPKHSTLESVRLSRTGPDVMIVPDRTKAVVSDRTEPLTFGGKDGLSVFVVLKTAHDSQPGSTLGGGSADVTNGGTTVSTMRLEVVVQDNIPSAHGFAQPGAVTDLIVIHNPQKTASGEMRLAAPPGTTFERVLNDAGVTSTISPDHTTATIARTRFGAGYAIVWVSIRLPVDAGHDAVFEGGRATIVDSGTVRASGGFTVSTHPVTLSQQGGLVLGSGAEGTARVRIQNHVPRETSGFSFAITAPTGTVFSSQNLAWKGDQGTSGTGTGTLSADRRTLTYQNDDLVLHGSGWVDVSTRLTATGGSTGTIADGTFAISPGSRALPTGTATTLAYEAVVQRLGDLTVSTRPGGTVTNIAVGMPSASVNGVMTIVAPDHSRIGTVTLTEGGRVQRFNTGKSTYTVTLPRTAFAPTTLVRMDLLTQEDARPTRTYVGSVTITDGDVTLATAEIRASTTMDGCLTWARSYVPAYGIVMGVFFTDVVNRCSAAVDVRVHYGTGTTSWKSIPANGEATFNWWVPYDAPGSVERGSVRPLPEPPTVAPTFRQTTIPAPAPGESRPAVLLVTSTVPGRSALGTSFTVRAPTGTTIESDCVWWASSDHPRTGQFCGTRSADHTTLTVMVDDFALPAQQNGQRGWHEITPVLRANTDGSERGTFCDGRLIFIGGPAVTKGAGTKLCSVSGL